MGWVVWLVVLFALVGGREIRELIEKADCEIGWKDYWFQTTEEYAEKCKSGCHDALVSCDMREMRRKAKIQYDRKCAGHPVQWEPEDYPCDMEGWIIAAMAVGSLAICGPILCIVLIVLGICKH